MSSFKIIDNYTTDKNEDKNNEDEWYTIHSSKIIDKMAELEKKIEKNTSTITDMDKKMAYFEKQVKDLTNENLRLVNRLLEAEISLERAKNSLVRKHIPFPFTPYISSFSPFQYRENVIDDVKGDVKGDDKDKKNLKL